MKNRILKDKPKPLVSVIVPNYNHARFLDERLRSIFSQTYENYEVIILDDKSSDGSIEIIDSYRSHPKVSCIIANEVNSRNTFLQWDKGIRLAKGEYVWIAESDDAADGSFLSELMCRLLSHPKAVLAFSHSYLIDTDGKVINKDADRTWLYKEPGIYDGGWFLLHRLSMVNTLYNASMIVWKRECFDKVSPDFMKYRHCGDWLFWMEVCQQGLISEVPKKLNMFRQHQGKVTDAGIRTSESFIEIGHITRFFLNKIGTSNYQRRVIRGFRTRRLYHKMSKSQFQKYSSMFNDIYSGSILDVLIYNFDKVFNFSKMQYKRRFHCNK